MNKFGRGYLWNGQILNCLHQNHVFAVRCFSHKLRLMFLLIHECVTGQRRVTEASVQRARQCSPTRLEHFTEAAS